MSLRKVRRRFIVGNSPFTTGLDAEFVLFVFHCRVGSVVPYSYSAPELSSRGRRGWEEALKKF